MGGAGRRFAEGGAAGWHSSSLFITSATRAIVTVLVSLLALVAVPTAATAAETTTFLQAGSRIDSCNSMTSPNGRYLLQLGCDGGLALVEDLQQTLWSTATNGIGDATLEMQADGNLV